MTALPANARVGLIAEGEHDLRVITDWITRIVRPGLRLLPEDQRRLAPKPELLRVAPGVAGALHDAGCDHVVIVWDLAAFADIKRTVQGDLACFWAECDAEDNARCSKGLARLDRSKICPVVAAQELEAWLLADERALRAYLARPTHPVRIDRTPHPEREPNPKKRLNQIVQQARGKLKPYVDYLDAVPLGAQIDDVSRLGKLRSFKELMSNVGAPSC